MWEKILLDEPLTGEGWEANEHDEFLEEAFDSDNWSSDGSTDEIRTPRSRPTSRASRRSSRALKHGMGMQADSAEMGRWREELEAQVQTAKDFRESLSSVIAKSEVEIQRFADPRQITLSEPGEAPC